eukprot:1156875-Pelagomonas_calceolata.AAC.2
MEFLQWLHFTGRDSCKSHAAIVMHSNSNPHRLSQSTEPMKKIGVGPPTEMKQPRHPALAKI